jgi:FKBP-type peptidyl-prolyl cis-trans isomerase FklB
MSEVNLSTDETRVSYGIGRQLGDQLRDNPPPGVSLDAILAGLTDAFAGAKPCRSGRNVRQLQGHPRDHASRSGRQG